MLHEFTSTAENIITMAFLYHVRLAELDADFHFHKPLHNGSIVLETGIRRYLDADTRLSHSELLALTLNEIAMTRGHGIVYWVPDIHQMSEGGAKTLKLGATPDLLYEDRAWTEDEMALYRARDHDERWVACAPSERNKLYPSTPVIPIRLVVHESEDTTALPSADICSVMLYYRKGEAYLGWMKDWMIKGSSSRSSASG